MGFKGFKRRKRGIKLEETDVALGEGYNRLNKFAFVLCY